MRGREEEAVARPWLPRLPGWLAEVGRMREMAILGVVLASGLALHLATPNFLTGDNLKPLGIGFATDAIIAVGMTMVIVAGGFDLSVGSVLSLSGVVCALLLDRGSPMAVAVGAALGAGAAAGLTNGLIITKARVNPLIATLGMMGVAHGVALVLTQGSPVGVRMPQSFWALGQGHLMGVPVPVALMVLVVGAGDLLLRKSRFLRQVYYVGGNEKAARLSGIRVDRVRTATYLVTGLLSALAGVVATSRFGSVHPDIGKGTELRVISAVVIGGASLAGGEGSVSGALLGLMLMAIVDNGLIHLRVPIYWQEVPAGLILISAVTLDMLSRRRRGE